MTRVEAAAPPAARYRVRVRTPKMARMKAVTGFYDLWRRISNDEVFGLERVFAWVTGEHLLIMHEEGDERWPAMHALIRTLERAAASLNFLLGAERFWLNDAATMDEAIEFAKAVADFRDRPEQYAPDDPHLARAISLLAGDVIHTVVMSARPPRGKEFDWMFVLDFERRTPEAVVAGERFDVFISYKHATYSDDATALYEQLTSLGLRCWLDREVLTVKPGEWVDPAALKRLLKQGLRSSDLTVSFETYDQAFGDEDFRGSHTAFNYQAFEWRHANHLAYVRSGILDVPELGRRVVFYGPTGLAEQVAAFWRTLQPLPPRRETRWRSEDPPLGPALYDLRRLARTYFGQEIRATPDAALALLTAGRVEQAGGELGAFPDDVLMAAVRHDPGCAVELHRAGVDLEALFDVGARMRRTRWKSPGSYVIKDCMGHPHIQRAQRVGQITRAGEMTGTDVACAILQTAAAHPIAARQLLERVYRRAFEGLEPEKALGFVKEVAAAFSAALDGPPRPRGIRWALYDDAGTLRFTPLSACDACRVEGLGAGGAVPAAVCVTHRDEVFTTPSGDTPPISLQGGVLQGYFERHPEMQVLLADAPPRLTTLYEPAGSARGSLRFFLQPLTPPTAVDDADLQADDGLKRVLAGARHLERDRGNDADVPPVSADLIPHRAIVFGGWGVPGAADAYPLHTALSAVLAVGPAVELHRTLVGMEYDDF